MKRSALREQVFALLFREPFHTEEEMAEQEALFLAPPELQEERPEEVNFPDPFSDDETLPVLTKAEAVKVRERYDAVRDKLSDIDALLGEQTAGWDLKRIGKVELAILRLAVFEIRFDEAVPDAVAINEAVELAKRFGQEGAPSFVNGVLAKFV